MAKKKLPKFNGSLRVVIIEDDAERVFTSLGISQKRMDDLLEIAKETWAKNERVSVILEQVSLHCKHPNELAYISYMLGLQNGAPHHVAQLVESDEDDEDDI